MRKIHYPTPRSAGFTLIELLAVLMIISILMAVLVVNLRSASSSTLAGNARIFIGQIGTTLGEYSDGKGDYPPSQLAAEFGAPPNATNVGSECLYLALCAEGAPGYASLGKSKNLCNTDNDSLSKRPKGFEVQELFEMADPWGNPIAYIRASDYDREFQYICKDAETGEEIECTVKAKKNAKTGRWEEPTSFQLICAGIDGKFGTEDDITNFDTTQAKK